MRACQRIIFAAVMVGFVAALFAAPASAKDRRSVRKYNRSGPYIGMGVGWAHPLFESDLDSALDRASSLGIDQRIQTDVDDSFAVQLLAGYRLFTFLAAELDYEYVHTLDVRAENLEDPFFSPQGGQVSRADFAGHTVTFNTKWIVPFWRIQPYALLGVGVAHYAIDKKGDVPNEVGALELFRSTTGVAGRLGTGIDFYVNRNWVVNVGSSFVLSDKKLRSTFDSDINADGLHYLSFNAGVHYRF